MAECTCPALPAGPEVFLAGPLEAVTVADQGIWFKLHCSALDDPDLDNLSVADFGRWGKLGAFVKRHGTAGAIRIHPPARTLCALFQVATFEELIEVCHRFPHVTVRRDNSTVSHETSLTVTYDNWLKYQGDFSSPRVRRFREMKRSKRRGDERRRDERRGDPSPLLSPPAFQAYWTSFWASYPSKTGKGEAEEALKKVLTQRGRHKGKPVPTLEALQTGLARWHRSRRWAEGFYPNPATWLNQRRWQDEPLEPSALSDKTRGNVEAVRRAVATLEGKDL